MSIPRVLIPDNAVATDKAVGMIQTELAARYDWLDHAFGVSQLMTKSKQRTDYNYPAVHYKDDRYLDMFPTNKMGNTCFFITDDPQGIEEFIPNVSNRLVFDCSVVFWVNLNDVYPGETSRQKENLKIELLNFFNNVMKFQGARFKVNSVAERFDNVYAEYSEDEIKSQYLMHPYCALRFEGEMTVDQECIITQPLTYDLTLEAGEGGIVQPYEGTQTYNRNQYVAINAVPNVGYDFEKWTFSTGQEVTDGLTTVLMNNDKSALATFISNMTVIQDVFGTTPVNQQFIDQIGNNDVTYKNVQVGKFNGDSSYIPIINPSQYFTSDSFSIVAFVKIINTLKTEMIINFGGNDLALGGSYLRIESHNSIRLTVGDTITRNVDQFDLPDNTFEVGNSYKIIVTSSLNEKKIYIDKILLDSISMSLSGTLIGNPINPNIGSFRGLNTFYSNIISNIRVYNRILNKSDVDDICDGAQVDNTGLIINYYFQDGDDDIIIDTSQNGNDSQVVGAILSDFRGTRIDGIDSVLINNGYTLFQQIADPTKYITAAYDINGIPTLTSKTGYNKIAEIPHNVVSDNKITYDNVQGSISGVDNTYDELNALGLPEYEVTKTANYISNFKVNA